MEAAEGHLNLLGKPPEPACCDSQQLYERGYLLAQTFKLAENLLFWTVLSIQSTFPTYALAWHLTLTLVTRSPLTPVTRLSLFRATINF